MAASFVTSSLHLGHIATAMLPLCNNELTERCYHFGLTFVIKQPLRFRENFSSPFLDFVKELWGSIMTEQKLKTVSRKAIKIS